MTEFWDGGSIKVFHGVVEMTTKGKTVKPHMAHFIYMDEVDASRVRKWVGSVGPTDL